MAMWRAERVARAPHKCIFDKNSTRLRFDRTIYPSSNCIVYNKIVVIHVCALCSANHRPQWNDSGGFNTIFGPLSLGVFQKFMAATRHSPSLVAAVTLFCSLYIWRISLIEAKRRKFNITSKLPQIFGLENPVIEAIASGFVCDWKQISMSVCCHFGCASYGLLFVQQQQHAASI